MGQAPKGVLLAPRVAGPGPAPHTCSSPLALADFPGDSTMSRQSGFLPESSLHMCLRHGHLKGQGTHVGEDRQLWPSEHGQQPPTGRKVSCVTVGWRHTVPFPRHVSAGGGTLGDYKALSCLLEQLCIHCCCPPGSLCLGWLPSPPCAKLTYRRRPCPPHNV